jgi:serine/threonine-protein kinase RsbT
MNPSIKAQSSGEVSISCEGDIVIARRTVRDAAAELGFTQTDVARIVTAASELARNVFRYAGAGVMRWSIVEHGDRMAIEVRFIDRGPGIADINLALTEGYSTGGGLGMGLPGAKRLVDELEIESVVGQGTTVTLKKWRRDDRQKRT